MAYIHVLHRYDPENSFPSYKKISGGSTVSVFFNGCSKKCLGCWSPSTWGRKKSLYVDNTGLIQEILEALDEYFPKQLALLGGDPLEASFEQDFRNNAEDTYEILSEIKKARPQTKVIVWTGYTWEECLEIPIVKKILVEGLIDLLVDGKFEIDNKVEGKMYGSSNQKIIDVKESLALNEKIVLDL